MRLKNCIIESRLLVALRLLEDALRATNGSLAPRDRLELLKGFLRPHRASLDGFRVSIGCSRTWRRSSPIGVAVRGLWEVC